MSDNRIKAVIGTKDILPEESKLWIKLISSIARVISSYNYYYIQTPVFELTELFARGIGETSDVVSKEMYTFMDKGERSLTLRPEGTAPVVRAYNEHSLGASQGLVKVWYAGPMFRQERPQAGRQRQFHQFGIEALGSLDPALDAEVIELSYRIHLELGISDSEIFINSVGMPEDRRRHREQFVKFVTPIYNEFCDDCKRRFHTNPLRMFDCKVEKCRSLLGDAPLLYDYLSKESLSHFELVSKYLELMKVPCKVDKKMVRGLDYYTRTAWEIKSHKLGAQDSLGGGGRYDLLAEQLGGKPTPAIGYAGGLERMLLAIPQDDVKDSRKDLGFFIITADQKFKDEAIKLSAKLHSLGIKADIDYLGRSLKSQMKQADKFNLKYAIILAEQEMEHGKIAVRDMDNSEQTEIALEKIHNLTSIDELGEIIGRDK